MASYHVDRIDWSRAVLAPGFEGQASGFARQALIDDASGSVHMGLAACSLAADGHVADHVHSFEESFYVLEGSVRLTMHGRSAELEPGCCGIVPVGVAHSWSGSGHGGRWIESTAPQPRRVGGTRPADTFFLDAAGERAQTLAPVDIRDPRTRHFFRLGAADMAISELQRGSKVEAPTVSASMATALLVYSGIAVKMLVDQRLDAQLSTMFMVEYQPGGVAHPHDHPFEESYLILEGEVDAVADGERTTLRVGDVFWTSVGCVHAFYNASGSTVRWLETQAPQPPARHSYRFDRDWDYLEQVLGAGGST